MNEVEEIKARLDLADVIGGYVPLKQTGRNFKGLSPFKQEKTPSFIVSPDKGIWHDFSSGQGGDVFSFVMLMEGVEFRDALEILARRAGVVLKPRSEQSSSQAGVKERIYKALEEAMKFYHLALSKDEAAKKYCMSERGLSGEVIKKYRVGYSSDSWEALSTFLMQKGYKPEELKQAGLVAQKAGRSSVYDIFRGRVMFPIFDAQGRVVGFSARILKSDDSGAKYINTPDSLVYHKSNAIYGLYQAKDAIREHDSIIVVEGNIDVIALAQAGYANTVAVSGTALTFDQLRILSRHSKNILLCFDQDSAGIAATKRAIELASDLDIRLSVVSFGDAKDPDELLQKDPKAWAAALKNAAYAPDYLLGYAKSQFDITTGLGKKQFATFVLPTIARLSDTIEKDHYATKIAQMIGIDESVVRQRLSAKAQPARPLPQENTEVQIEKEPDKPLSRQEKIEQNLAEVVLTHLVARPALQDITPQMISERHRELLITLKQNPKATVVRLAKLLPEISNYVKILELRGEQVYSDLSDHDARLEAFTQVNRLEKIHREKLKRTLSAQIAEAESAGDSELRKKLLNQYQALINEDS